MISESNGRHVKWQNSKCQCTSFWIEPGFWPKLWLWHLNMARLGFAYRFDNWHEVLPDITRVTQRSGTFAPKSGGMSHLLRWYFHPWVPWINRFFHPIDIHMVSVFLRFQFIQAFDRDTKIPLQILPISPLLCRNTKAAEQLIVYLRKPNR